MGWDETEDKSMDSQGVPMISDQDKCPVCCAPADVEKRGDALLVDCSNDRDCGHYTISLPDWPGYEAVIRRGPKNQVCRLLMLGIHFGVPFPETPTRLDKRQFLDAAWLERLFLQQTMT